MHAGRIAHADNKEGEATVAPSAVRAPGEIITADGSVPHDEPQPIPTAELPDVLQEFVTAARNAVEAGLDGVEVHAANGYLLHQFLAPSTNHRDDAYGGGPAERARFVIEVVTAVAEAIGAEKVGVRISPGHAANGIEEPDADDVAATYTTLVDAIAPLGLAYLSILADPEAALFADLRRRFGGPVVANDGFGTVTTRERAEQIVADGLADLVAVGRLFIANPDLDRRWREDAPLNEPDPSTFYGGGAEGYTDYPTLEQSA